jgi:uncharacterized membrane protein
MGENHFSSLPTAMYGVVLFMAALSYWILQNCIIAVEGGKESLLAKAVARDYKGKLSILFYAAALPLAFWHEWLADTIYVLVAIIWLIPDTRIEKVLAE